jgi:hypothetical protein
MLPGRRDAVADRVRAEWRGLRKKAHPGPFLENQMAPDKDLE